MINGSSPLSLGATCGLQAAARLSAHMWFDSALWKDYLGNFKRRHGAVSSYIRKPLFIKASVYGLNTFCALSLSSVGIVTLFLWCSGGLANFSWTEFHMMQASRNVTKKLPLKTIIE